MKNNIKKALRAHKTGNLKEAEELYLKCITTSPNDSNGWYLYGALCQQIGKTRLAKKYLDRSIKLTANFPEAEVLCDCDTSCYYADKKNNGSETPWKIWWTKIQCIVPLRLWML